MSKFIEVTVLYSADPGEPGDKDATWKEILNIDNIVSVRRSHCEGAGSALCTVRGHLFDVAESYEKIRGVLMGKGTLPATHGECPKCGLVHDMDQVCNGL